MPAILYMIASQRPVRNWSCAERLWLKIFNDAYRLQGLASLRQSIAEFAKIQHQIIRWPRDKLPVSSIWAARSSHRFILQLNHNCRRIPFRHCAEKIHIRCWHIGLAVINIPDLAIMQPSAVPWYFEVCKHPLFGQMALSLALLCFLGVMPVNCDPISTFFD